MTDETRPFAYADPGDRDELEPPFLVVAGETVAEPGEDYLDEDFDDTMKSLGKDADRINAAHESRCQARERRAAVKALRAFADGEALKDDFGHGEVITKHDVRTALRAEAAAIERGEVSP